MTQQQHGWEWISRVQETIWGMAEEADPAAAVADPVVDPAVDPAVVDPSAVDPAATPDPAAEPKADWKDKRIAKQTARLHELQAELEKFKKASVVDPAVVAAPGESQADFDSRVEERARQLAGANDFNRQCEEARKAGDKAFPDFGTKVKALVDSQVDRTDAASVQSYNSFLSAALETGEAPALIHQLGGNLEEAARILALSPVKMAVELTKLAAKVSQASEETKTSDNALSGAPRPITPVGGRAAAHTQIDPTDPARADALSTAEWMRRRNAQVSKGGNA